MASRLKSRIEKVAIAAMRKQPQRRVVVVWEGMDPEERQRLEAEAEGGILVICAVPPPNRITE